MKKCESCGKILKAGDEVHILKDEIFCSAECAIAYMADFLICSAKEQATAIYNNNVSVLTLRPSSKLDTCELCGQYLATCDTIYAAEGKLYCSRNCGVLDYCHKDAPRSYAEEVFDSVSEELNPKDIGLEI